MTQREKKSGNNTFHKDIDEFISKNENSCKILFERLDETHFSVRRFNLTYY